MIERKPVLLRSSAMAACDRGDGVETVPLVTQGMGSLVFLSGITTFAPNAAVPLHFHNCDESVFILEGNAIAEIGDAKHVIAPGSMSFIPTGIPHRFANASPTAPMRILWTYASIHADRTIVATGENRRIDAEHGSAAER